MKTRPILIVEDNPAERYLLQHSFEEAKIQNEIIFANDGIHAYDLLINQGFKPFMIIADINMPRMNGLELKKKLDEHGHLATVPFIFMTHSIRESEVIAAYSLRAQGYFEKRDLENQTKLLELITQYWKEAEIPRKD